MYSLKIHIQYYNGVLYVESKGEKPKQPSEKNKIPDMGVRLCEFESQLSHSHAVSLNFSVPWVSYHKTVVSAL